MVQARPQIENYLDTGGPFPDRIHLIALGDDQVDGWVRRLHGEVTVVEQACARLPSDDTSLWIVWRQDDNGNRFEVARKDSRSEAETLTATMEARGHKHSAVH